jgi:hypothetical protein
VVENKESVTINNTKEEDQPGCVMSPCYKGLELVLVNLDRVEAPESLAERARVVLHKGLARARATLRAKPIDCSHARTSTYVRFDLIR